MLAIYGLGRLPVDSDAGAIEPVVTTRPIIDRSAQPESPAPPPPIAPEPVMALPTTPLFPSSSTTYVRNPGAVFDPGPTAPVTAATPTVTVSPPPSPMPPTAPPFTPLPQPPESGSAAVLPDTMSPASAATPTVAIGPAVGPATMQPAPSSGLPGFIVGLSPIGKAALGIGLLALIGIAIHRITKRR